jgi:hypothetical protein
MVAAPSVETLATYVKLPKVTIPHVEVNNDAKLIRIDEEG